VVHDTELEIFGSRAGTCCYHEGKPGAGPGSRGRRHSWSATVRAVSEVRVLSLGRAQFQALVDASSRAYPLRAAVIGVTRYYGYYGSH